MKTAAAAKRQPTQLFLFGQESINVHRSPHSIVVGDVIRVSGGPTSRGRPICARGVFRVEGLVFDPRFMGRVWLDCSRLEMSWRRIVTPIMTHRQNWSEAIPCGRFLLYASGPKYRRKDFPGMSWQPFVIKKIRNPKS